METGTDSIKEFIASLPEIGGGLRSRTVDLDPPLAQVLLNSQGHNRKVKRDLVERLARDIKEGRWQLNAQPLLIDLEEHLGDGQHRCLAVMKAEITVPVVVTFGISPSAFPTLDSGRSRSPGDVLHLRGEKATGSLTRALSLISLYKRDLMKRNRWSEAATNAEREQLLEQHPEIRDSVARCARAKGIIAPGVLAYVHWRARQVAEKTADEFVEAVATGTNLAEENPAYVLREVLLRNKASRKKKLLAYVILAYTIKAFNAYAKNEPMRLLRWTEREGFPEFISSESDQAKRTDRSVPMISEQVEAAPLG